MYNDTVTLFCRYQDESKKVTWYPFILHGVNINMDKASIISKYGEESKDNAVLNVRYQNVDGKKMAGDKIWLPPKEWRGQSGDSLQTSFTFAGGQAFDFFYVGEWTGTEPIEDDDYVDGFYNHMKNLYDYVFAITSAGGPYSVIPHFEIMGA